MIIYGTRFVHLKSGQPKSIACTHCGQTDTTILSAYSKHAHIFWIPIFPIGRVVHAQCTHCKQALEYKNMSHELQRESNNLKAETKAPIWQFAGLALIAGLIGLGMYSSGQAEKSQLEYIANPKAEDIYSIETDDKNYTTLKVTSVSSDSVFLSPNKYQTDKRTGIYEIDKAENYAEETYGMSRKYLNQMLQDGDIYSIERH
jgi:hypothetical protein